MGIKSSTRPRPRRSRSWPPTVSGIGGLGLCGALRRRRAAVVRAAGARGRRLGDQDARALLQSVIRAPLDLAVASMNPSLGQHERPLPESLDPGGQMEVETVVDTGESQTAGVNRGPSSAPLRLVVNGATRVVDLEPRTSLLDALREHMQLTGSKKGC